MDVVCMRCAGLDEHKRSVTACRITPDPTGQEVDGHLDVQTFGTLTIAWLALSDGLAEAGITPVALESTGESWKPVSNLLEGTVEVCVVKAAHVKHVPGRQTEQADARWLAQLLRYGLLQASLIPPQGQRDVRDLARYRTTLVPERSREVNRVQGVLERATITLASVASDSMGVSARAMVEALMAGRTDPATMADVARGRMRATMPELTHAFTGIVRDHHRLLLATPLAPIDVLEEQLDTLSQEITRCLVALSAPDAATAPTSGGPKAQPPTVPAATDSALTWTQAIALVDTMPGVDQRGAELLVAEIGIDMTRCGSAPRVAAWAGVAPGNDERAGVRRSGRTRQGNRTLRTALVQLAHGAVRTKGTSLAACSHRLAARRGKKRAIMAVAHSMLVRALHMLTRQEPYRELGANSFDQLRRAQTVDRFTRRLEHLGYRVYLKPVPTP
jgi:transposase